MDVVLRSLKLELRLQTRGRPQSGWQVATPGSIEWTRGFFPLRNDDEICMGDAVCGVNEQARTFTGTQTGARKCEKSKQSSVASAKQLLLTGNASSRPVPRTLAEQTSADSDSAVDLWALPAGERWTCRAICCSLIGMLFQIISRPPFKPAKLLFTLPLIMLGVWQQAMKAPSHCASSLAPHLVSYLTPPVPIFIRPLVDAWSCPIPHHHILYVIENQVLSFKFSLSLSLPSPLSPSSSHHHHQVIKPLPLGPLAPFAALGAALPILVAQCYVVSFPLTAGLCSLAIQFSDIIDGAFAAMATALEDKLRSYVRVMHLQTEIEEKVVYVLARPPLAAIGLARGLMPNFASLFPEWFKSGTALAPVTFVLLAALLILLQALTL